MGKNCRIGKLWKLKAEDGNERELIFDEENTRAVLANNDLFAEPDLIDKLRAQFHLAGRTDFSVNDRESKSLFFNGDPIVELAQLGR
jgi:hypothetical protein